MGDYNYVGVTGVKIEYDDYYRGKYVFEFVLNEDNATLRATVNGVKDDEYDGLTGSYWDLWVIVTSIFKDRWEVE